MLDAREPFRVGVRGIEVVIDNFDSAVSRSDPEGLATVDRVRHGMN